MLKNIGSVKRVFNFKKFFVIGLGQNSVPLSNGAEFGTGINSVALISNSSQKSNVTKVLSPNN